MSNPNNERYRQILEAARKRDGSSGTDTMVVNSHLAQMKLFMLRQGIEFFPTQDTFGFRRLFLNQLVEENEIDSRLEGIVDDFLIDGKGLFYFRPINDTYRLMWFSKDNYRAYYDAQSELEEVELIYSFNVRSGVGALAIPGVDGGSKKYVKLRVRRDSIKESITSEKPSFEAGAINNFSYSPTTTRTLTNSLGFVPAVESFNTMKSTGMDSTGDFDWLSDQIVLHDDLVKNIRTNITFFGNPTLVSSRPKHDLVESAGEDTLRPTISSQAGFSSAGRPSTRNSDPGASGGSGKVPRIIANVEPTDRAVYLTPDAVSGDQNLYARQYREELRTALGGVDELGISSGATAYEIKSLYGRAATTATRRCRGLLTYGLAKLFALIIYHEERIFRDSFAMAVGMQTPIVPIKEDFAEEQDYILATNVFAEQRKVFEAELDLAIQTAVQDRNLPPGVVGLIPDGNRKVEWRWKGPVFEDGTDDILNSSIVVRNLQELGVNSVEALRYLFPDKTDEERSAMLSGYPFRMAQATQSSIGTFLSLINDMRQTPHPQAPDLPLLADPKLDLTPYVYRAIEFLKRELTYSGQYTDDTGSGDPAELDTIERARAARGLPTSTSPERPSFVPDSFGSLTTDSSSTSGAAGTGSGTSPGGEPMAGGVQESQRQFERNAELPTPGSLLDADPTGTNTTAKLPLSGERVSGSSISFGDADLRAPSNAGLFPDTAATDTELTERSESNKQRRVSRQRKSRKS
ncbi:MAG: hypothetical protein CMB76_05795 [Euryarchaeota archaeon]|nr:hypothetical protein [Euryarchaeota archaeon]|tara:strand:- start:1794 stop:4031 length:2238 start_codon:yes stop_codon:yes gene_type:complete